MMLLKTIFLSMMLPFLALAETSQRIEVDINGTVSFHNEAGYWISDWFDFDVPKGLGSFVILLKGQMNTTLQITDLVDPNGFVFVKSSNHSDQLSPYDFPLLNNVLSPNRSEAVVPGTGSLLVPNSPHLAAPSPGRWKARILAMKQPVSESLSIEIVGKKIGHETESAFLPVYIWVDQHSPWGQNDAITSKLLQDATLEFKKIGIQMIVRSRVKENLATNYPMALPEAMTNIALLKNKKQGINIYLMGEMENQSKPINGLACLGGPAYFNTPHGCFASLYAREDFLKIQSAARAKIFVHEVGHYLGLFHTQDRGYEKINVVHDPFDDTPEEVTGENLMDPGIHQAHPHFSEEQVRLLKTHPAVSVP